MSLFHAFRYPFQARGWFKRILVLAIAQVIPIVGQLILIGYGLEVVRSVYTGRTGLPAIRGLQALRDGGLVLITGLLYCFPLLTLIPIILTFGIAENNTSPNDVSQNVIRLFLTIIATLILSTLAGRLRLRSKRVRSLLTGLVAIIPIITVISLISNAYNLQAVSATGLRSLNGIGILLFALLAFFVLLIIVGLLVSSVRYAVEKRGLFDPMGTLRILFKNRIETRLLLLNLIFLGLIAVLTIGIGLILFILPGLFACVCCSLAMWHLLANFSMKAGFNKLAP